MKRSTFVLLVLTLGTTLAFALDSFGELSQRGGVLPAAHVSTPAHRQPEARPR